MNLRSVLVCGAQLTWYTTHITNHAVLSQTGTCKEKKEIETGPLSYTIYKSNLKMD